MDNLTLKRRVSKQKDVTQLILEAKNNYGFGYRPEVVDIRDITTNMLTKPQIFDSKEKQEIAQVFTEKVNINDGNLGTDIEPAFNFANEMSDIRNQLNLGACVYFKQSGEIEYFAKSKKGVNVQTSPLYGYKKGRDMAGEIGDVGSTIRGSFKQLVTYGWIPEKEYPYITKRFDEPIKQELIDMGYLNQGLSYVRLDRYTQEQSREALLAELKQYLRKKIPIGFGFTVFQSLNNVVNTGLIPYPARNEQVLGGHAVLAVGYDDNIVITNRNGNVKTRGAIMIRNSWSNKWGNKGYGYLPYQYFLDGIAMDLWGLLDIEWLNWADFE